MVTQTGPTQFNEMFEACNCWGCWFGSLFGIIPMGLTCGVARSEGLLICRGSMPLSCRR